MSGSSFTGVDLTLTELGKVNYTFMKNTILVIAEELGTSGYNTSMNEERNKGAFVMDAESMDINRLFGSGGNDCKC